MAPKKKVVGLIKLQIQAGQANPAPPVGPALGQHGVNIMEFCKAYNAATESQRGNVIPVEISVYEDRSFTFALKTPPRPRRKISTPTTSTPRPRSSPAPRGRWVSPSNSRRHQEPKSWEGPLRPVNHNSSIRRNQ